MGILVTLSRGGGGSIPCEFGAVWPRTEYTCTHRQRWMYVNHFLQIHNHMTTSTSIQPICFSKCLHIIYTFVLKLLLSEAAGYNRKRDIV